VLRAVYLRSAGGVQHTFAIESFIDELAAEAAADPLEFRLRHLKDERAIRLLRAVADKAGWQRQEPRRDARPRSGVVSGRGLCFTRFRDLGKTPASKVTKTWNGVDVAAVPGGRLRLEDRADSCGVGIAALRDGCGRPRSYP
jgi:CO/xanthine dehydrogenase Mo-binding subunit